MIRHKVEDSIQFILGIDEAGRGPVIGPMIICGVLIRKEDIPQLTQIGVRDSKLLSPDQRERLKISIEKIVSGWEIIKISPSQIDRCGINYLELKSTARLINKFSPHFAVIDAPTCWCKSYERKLQALLGKKKTRLIVENYADKRYLVVSAASILAKVTRDKEIEEISRQYGEVGSGYTSDAKTIQFLKKTWREKREFPDIVRRRWKTIQKISLSWKEKDNKREDDLFKLNGE